MKKTIGILAHVDAGKTTFSEQLLVATESIKTKGRVDEKTAFLDYHSVEKERGITVFSDETTFTYKDAHYYLIDTPGHLDFSPEMERSIQMLDYAILIISAPDGVQGHTESIWELLQRYHIPTFIFFNKMDQLHEDFETVCDEASSRLQRPLLSYERAFNEDIIEQLAEADESLIEAFLNDTLSLHDAVLHSIQHQSTLFYGSGSALHDEGILPFFDFFHTHSPTSYDEKGEATGFVYKIRDDAQGQKNTFIKLQSGALEVRDDVIIGDEQVKITQLRSYRGAGFQTVQRAEAGELVALLGARDVSVYDCLQGGRKRVEATFIPTLRARVIGSETISQHELVKVFQRLDEEDDSLQVLWERESAELYIHILGPIQLETLQQTVLERFQLSISFGEPIVLYRETIEGSTVGYGHFEPLRHYAEVHVRIEQAPLNSGIHVQDETHPNDMTSGNRTEIRNALLKKPIRSILTGAPLTDVTITCIAGRGHKEHSSPGDFRQATWRAVRQGLEKAKVRLLEPMYTVQFTIPEQHIGKLMTDIQQLHGTCEAPVQRGTSLVVKAVVPVARFLHYPEQFYSFTKGLGSLRFTVTHFDYCHNEQEVIEASVYDSNADPHFTSSSIFCAKGAGYSVSGVEAESMMHIEKAE
ncbi:GTP-binding protein [Savagea faecisuis]|uniref:GTP-binding protein n=1 Tax=Savagea faecisuis TaxID=1274803 RepID=A0ABW3GZ40_9BACL